MGRHHARVYSELDNIDLIAVSDINAESTSHISSSYHVKSYLRYQDMLVKESPDIVSIAVPTQLHVSVANDAINMGIHVLLEKPIANNSTDAKKLIENARKKNVKLFIGHIERFNPAVVQLKKLLDKGYLGKIFQLRTRRVGPFPTYIKDVGVVLDLATHDIDLIEYLLESDIEKIYAHTDSHIKQDHEDMLSAIYGLSNGVTCVLDVNWLSPSKIRELFILGENGLFRLDYITQDLWFYENNWNGNKFDERMSILGISKGKVLKYDIKKIEPLKREINRFIRCVENDLVPDVTGETALKAFEIAKNTLKSSRLGRVIKNNGKL